MTRAGGKPMNRPAAMVDQPAKSLYDLVREVDRYPEEAFLFLRAGLGYAAEHIHGPETEAHRRLQRFLMEKGLDWSDLIVAYQAGELSPALAHEIDEAGGCDKLNRHVSGRELCWALRDFALERWGRLARTVLEQWHIRGTRDFGRIVFAFIECDMMRKQPDDRLEDFNDVYRFDDVFAMHDDDGLAADTAD